VATIKVLLGGLVVALAAAALAALAWIACYEVRACEGNPHTYTGYVLVAILSLLILSLMHVVSAKLRK